MNASAEVITGQCGEAVFYTLDLFTNTLTITGTGEIDMIPDYEVEDDGATDYIQWGSYRTQIKTVIIGEGITSVEEYAFEGFTELTKLELPESLTQIRTQAFYGCKKLREVQLPSQLQRLGDGAFRACESLETLTLPKTLTEFHPSSPVRQCKSLTAIFVEEGNPVYTAKDGVLFSADGRLLVRYPAGKPEESYTVPAEVRELAAYAFSECTALRRVESSGSVKKIGAYAFCGCSSLESVILGSTQQKIEDEPYYEESYYGCSKLDELYYDPEPENASAEVPGGDSSPISMIIPYGVTVIPDGAFANNAEITSITIPGSVERIGSYAFQNCSALTSVTIEHGVKSIGELAFRGCTALSSVTIPESVTQVGHMAFVGCTALKSVALPDSLTNIGQLAFGYRSNYLYDYDNDCPVAYLKNSFQIIGSRGSAAEAYAKEHYFPFIPTDTVTRYADVKTDAYYFMAAAWAIGRGVTNGTSAATFSPGRGCTRAQVLTFLWRAAGSPAPTSGNNPFTDVKASDYYCQAVLWAVEKGITKGVSKTEFCPNQTCTRGEVVTFLWRYRGSPAINDPQNPFTDVGESAYYTKAALWAVENSVTTGTSADKFSPNAECTRAQVVTFLYRADDVPRTAVYHGKTYELVLDNVTWVEAHAAAAEQDGKLVTLETEEEYRFVLDLILSQGDPNGYYHLGAQREIGKTEYYWVNADQNMYGTLLNDPSAWCYSLWQTGEPSFTWKEKDERAVILYYSKKEARWCLYDGYQYEIADGRQYGYIIEYP